ncbi:glycosyltransferase WbuB [Alkanindiges hydrocarboniclasticus]|uniref:Glycosyltransferase WbuB n=1 Tax=Alkanindiges hydrocarboniclasticus TaxID=1907941 RepID=A0A1S8CT39_9GAMM|nr:glycosyltransferase family 4 protein [Alkanindiges hydrocarboniclasticus]ONG38528.1 glycosyltransferase WbuB [Alkanindiges hydrocarboniclasticus]
MKIIYLHQYFNTPNMSGGTRSYEFAKRLVQKGHEVHIVTSWCRETDQQDWFSTVEDGINVHWFPNAYSNRMSFKQRIIAFFKFSFVSAIKAASIRADIVFATSTPLTIALPAVYAARRQKIPMVFEVRDLWPEVPIAMEVLKKPTHKYFAKKLEKWAYKNAKAIIALSPGMKEGILSTGYPTERVAVIPNSSDNDLFSINPDETSTYRLSISWLQNNPLLIYTGTFGFVNDVGYIIPIAKELLKLNKDIKILLVGDGIEYEKIKELAIEHNVFEQNVFLQKQLPKSEIPVLLSAATIACSFARDIPAIRANSANKFFDALAASKPILINYGGWQKDIIDKNNCGLVLWQDNPIEAASKIVEFISNSNQLKAASYAAKHLALNQFSRDTLAEQFEQVLNYALGVEKKSPQQITAEFYD